MIHKKYCGKCKATNVALIKQTKTATTQYYLCRTCNNERQYAYRKTDRGREVIRQIQERTKTKYPEKVKARKIVTYALSIGYLVKPEYCSKCKQKKQPKLIDGHHNDYKDALNVIWLCKSCHLFLHNDSK